MSSESSADPAAGAAVPALRIVRGDPTPEEVAVLTALVSAAGGGSQEPAELPRRGRWNDPSWMHRRTGQRGYGGWRSHLS